MPESAKPLRAWTPLTTWPADVIRHAGAIECRCADGSRFVTDSLTERQGPGGKAVAYRPLGPRTIEDAAQRLTAERRRAELEAKADAFAARHVRPSR